MRVNLIAPLALVLLLAVAGPAAASSIDTVVILDPTHDGRGFQWLERVLLGLEMELPAAERFGLLVPDGAGGFEKHDFSGSDWGSAMDVSVAMASYGSDSPGAGIDGWLGITTALALYTDIIEGLNLVLATDAGRDPWVAMNREDVRQAIEDRPDAHLNAMIDHGIDDGSGNAGLALRGAKAWVADGAGGWTTTMDGFPTSGGPDVGPDYAELAILSGGAFFDMNLAVPAGAGDLNPLSFRRGFVNVKVTEFAGAPELPPWGILPEPSTGALALAGLVLLGLWRRRAH